MPIYYFIEDPRRPEVQLASDAGIIFLFSSENLAKRRRDSFGSGIVRGDSIAGLMKKFCSCRKVHLDPGEEEPRKDEAISLSELK